MSLHFQHTIFIWLLAGLVIFLCLFILLIAWKRKVKKRMGDRKLIEVLTAGFSPRLFSLKFGLLSIAFAVGVLAVMNLRKPGDSDGISRKGIDVVIALDVSKSMLATDLAPDRLERAKQLINKLMVAMPNDRIGLVVFAGQAYLQMPLTTDHGAASMFVSSASPEAVPQQGTVISEALRRSAAAFNAQERRFKAVILISDGEDHDPEAAKTAKELSEQGLMINTVGIGSPEGAYIPDPATGGNKKDQEGNDVISRLNETSLKEMADNTNGIYLRLEDSDEAVRLLKEQLSQIETKAYGDISLTNYKTFYWWFAGGMLVLLLAEFFIPETKKESMTRLVFILMCCSFSTLVNAQDQEEAIRKGNELFKQQKFAEAEQTYTEVISKEANNETARFNLTVAAYRQNKSDEAIKQLNDLTFKTLDKDLKANSYYNKGVILSGQKKLEESIEAYKSALRLNPNDQQARENLQKALLEQKKNQPPPPKKEEKKKKEDQKKQQQQQPKMNQKEAQQRLKLLEQKEKDVQQRLQKEKSKQGGGQAKDW